MKSIQQVLLNPGVQLLFVTRSKTHVVESIQTLSSLSTHKLHFSCPYTQSYMIDDHPSAKPLAVDLEQEVQLINQSDSETYVRAVNNTTQRTSRN